MKCLKCNYTSFDFNRACPKCGNDNTEEQTRLNLSPNKPNPPFFLASLIGVEGAVNLGTPADDVRIPSAQTAPEEMDTQDLLIALDDLSTDDAQPEPPTPSTDEIVFDTDDSKENTLETLESAEDEILFDLEPASEEDALETIDIDPIDIDPLDKKGFSDFDGPDEKPVAVGVEEIPEEITDKDVTDEITFELGDTPQQVEQPGQKGTPDEIESAPEESQGLFLEEFEDKTDEEDLFLVDEPDEPALILNEEAPAEIRNEPEEPGSEELFLSLDDLPDGGSRPEPSASTQIEGDEIAFELEEALQQEETPLQKDTPDEKGFWDSDELEKQAAAFDLEETTDKKEAANLFQDLDVEPLDFELSLDDVEKKS